MLPASSSTAIKSNGDTKHIPRQASTTKTVNNYSRDILDTMTRPQISVQLALESSNTCSVIHKLEVENLLDSNMYMLDRFLVKMGGVKMIRKHGLVHWRGGGR